MSSKRKLRKPEKWNDSPFDQYKVMKRIGRGTYGKVSLCFHKLTKEEFAIKEFLVDKKLERVLFSVDAEILALKKLRHKNIIKMCEYYKPNIKEGDEASTLDEISASGRNKYFLALEYCSHELNHLINQSELAIPLPYIKMIMEQIIDGVRFMHRKKFIHRDLKPSNILIARSGFVKLTDFGWSIHARDLTIPKVRCGTRWYNAPEVLLGYKYYNNKIDVWSVGCIFGELFTRKPLMKGNNDKHQCSLITEYCGSMTTDTWPLVAQLDKHWIPLLPQRKTWNVPQKMQSAMRNRQALDLISKMLVLDPDQRIDMGTASSHDFFYVPPLPCEIPDLLLEYDKNIMEFWNRNRLLMM